MLVNRRAFIAAGSAAAAGILIASPVEGGDQKAFKNNPKGRVTIYRLSLRRRRGSRFAKVYNANMRFATKHAAERRRAHKGDRSRVVPLTVSIEEYHLLFTRRHAQWVDLREMKNLPIPRRRLR
jgi:hypothetical protein